MLFFWFAQKTRRVHVLKNRTATTTTAITNRQERMKCKIKWTANVDGHGPFERSVQNRYIIRFSLSLSFSIYLSIYLPCMLGNLVGPLCFSEFPYLFFPLHMHLLILVTHPLFRSCECAQNATFSLFLSLAVFSLKIRNTTKTNAHIQFDDCFHSNQTLTRTIAYDGMPITVWPV